MVDNTKKADIYKPSEKAGKILDCITKATYKNAGCTKKPTDEEIYNTIDRALKSFREIIKDGGK